MMNKRQIGFSLVELMVVLLIIMVISALAMPNVIRGIGTIRLRGAASEVSGMLQRARIQAVKSNRIQLIKWTTVNGANILYTDGPATAAHTAYNNSWDGDEGMVQISDSVELITDKTLGPAANFITNSGTLMSNTALTDLSTSDVAFNQRGLPCSPTLVSGVPTTCTTQAAGGYVYFMRSTGAFGGNWIAISMTQAGRIRVWNWNGNSWQ